MNINMEIFLAFQGYASEGVYVNCVCPHFVDTALLHHHLNDAIMDQMKQANLLNE